MSVPVDDADYEITTASYGLPQSPTLAFGNYQNEPTNRPACCPNPLYIYLSLLLLFWVLTVHLAGELPDTLFYSITFSSVPVFSFLALNVNKSPRLLQHCAVARVSVLMSVNLLVYAASR
ncbi:hypothetical protein ACEPAH_1746 [Sanghuangporus vaninii]